jgi:hypothetical protein
MYKKIINNYLKIFKHTRKIFKKKRNIINHLQIKKLNKMS